MKKCSRCALSKPLEAFQNDRAKKDGKRPACRSCAEEAWGAGVKAAVKRWRAANPARVAALKKKYRAAMPKTPRTPKDPTAPLRAKKAWKQRNPAACRLDRATRRAAEIGAIPLWADHGLMKDLYALARVYTDALGEPFHVDHTVPLRSKTVCGLHTHQNLDVLPGAENIRKSNRVWPGSDGAWA